jgi:hypothetical protein
LPSLQPLDQNTACLTFADIADGRHSLEEVDKILADNMPLAISLLAHLADSEVRHVTSAGHPWVMAGRPVRILVGNPPHGFGYPSPRVIEDLGFNSGTSGTRHRYP